jgi:hypothetical protein
MSRQVRQIEPCHYCVKETNTDYETFVFNYSSHRPCRLAVM